MHDLKAAAAWHRDLPRRADGQRGEGGGAVMTRDEVLTEVNKAAELFDGLAMDCCDEPGRVRWESRAAALRAAAEIIRESGKVAEALGEIVSCDPIDNDPVHKRIKYVEVQIHRTDMDRYRKIVADYFQPAPPAREESEAKNGEENDRQTQDNKCIG